MYSRSDNEKKGEQPHFLHKRIINKLHEQIQLEKLDIESYHTILSDLILSGKSEKYPENLLDSLSNGLAVDRVRVKEALYEALCCSWKDHNEPYSPTAGHSKSIPEILAWGYEVRSKKQKTTNLFSCDLSLFKIKKLTAFWESVKFSQLQSIKTGLNGFGKQSLEAWTISCKNIAQSQLISLTVYSRLSHLSTKVSAEMWTLFWSALELSNIEDLYLNFAELDSLFIPDQLWDILCEGLGKLKKLKSLGLVDMKLRELGRKQWDKLYQALKLINIESLDLSDNHLYEVISNDSQSFGLLCKIIKLPFLKVLTIFGDNFERIPRRKWHSVCQALADKTLDELKIELSFDNDAPQMHWLDFINALKKIPLKSLKIIHHSSNELSSVVVKAFCLMIEGSTTLKTLILKHHNGLLSLSAEDWCMLGEALKRRGIKSFNFGGIGLSGNKLSEFLAGLELSGIDALHLQNSCFHQLSPNAINLLSNFIKKVGISLFDLRGSYFVYQPLSVWKAFCELIVTSQIKILSFSIRNYHQLTPEQLKLFCDALKTSQLETLKLDLNHSYFRKTMEFSKFRTLLNAINESRIVSLPYPLNYEGISRERFELLYQTLQIIENRAKYKKPLSELCAAAFFGRYPNAQLKKTETGTVLIYEEDDQPLQVALPEEVISLLFPQ